MKAAIYCRVSTDEQTKGTSLATQEERCLAFIESRGWEAISPPYVDDGVSGAKESRPALDRLLIECGEGKVGVIVATEIDRFTRDERLWHNWKHLLTSFGVSIVTCDGTVDT